MIDVAFTRAQLQPAEVAVVVDVLRATSTATQALAAGYERVLCAGTVERALQLGGPGRVLAGERRCLKPLGFDQGNSPREALHRRGEELVLATTNGAPTIVKAASRAPLVLLACLLNLDAVDQALFEVGAADVQIVCSGTDATVALEDVYVAGRLSATLPGGRTDAALVAEGVARAFETPSDALAASADAAVLRQAGLAEDIEYCARESELDVVGVVGAIWTGVAAVGRLGMRTAATPVRAVDANGTVSV
ncbi:MAG: 2-phosphosulfolactate phosphatase [Solirubrobacteraceae bacterium]